MCVSVYLHDLNMIERDTLHAPSRRCKSTRIVSPSPRTEKKKMVNVKRKHDKILVVILLDPWYYKKLK